LELEEDRAAVDLLHRVQAELERGDDAKVSAAATERPEEIVVLVIARSHLLAVCGYDLGPDEVVDAQAHTAREIADPAAEGQAADTGRRDHASGRREPMLVRCVVEDSPRRAALGARSLRSRVDVDCLHGRHVDDDGVVAGPESGDAVTTAANGDRKAVRLRIAHSARN